MKTIVSLLALTIAAPAQAATLITLGDFNAPYTSTFDAVPTGVLSGSEAFLGDLGISAIEVSGAGPGEFIYPASQTGQALGATSENEATIIAPGSEGSLISLFLAFSAPQTKLAFDLFASEFTETFTVDFLSAFSIIDSYDFTTSGAGSYFVGLAANSSFDAINVTGLDKAVLQSLTVEVSPVPLPAALPPMLALLGGLGAVALRRRRRA